VGPDPNNARRLSTVNYLDQFNEKRLKNDPSVSTGALRSMVNSVKTPIYTPSFPLEH